MKIKEICEKTGLTDRTVRYYIEEGLIAPFYTENYLGRKSFNFSEEDLERLKSIATLRTFGFSVEEIKALDLEDGNNPQIVETAKKRAEEALDESNRRLSALSALDLSDSTNILELAQRLNESDLVVENESSSPNIKKRVLSLLESCIIFLAVWLPVVLGISLLVIKFATLNSPILHPDFLIYTLLCFLPSMAAVIVLQTVRAAKKALRIIFITLCVLCIPLTIIFSSKSIVECDHSYETFRTVIEATCQHDGEIVAKCTACGNLETQKVERTSHLYNKENVDPKYIRSEPTMSVAATYYYSCECGRRAKEYFSYGLPLPSDAVPPAVWTGCDKTVYLIEDACFRIKTNSAVCYGHAGVGSELKVIATDGSWYKVHKDYTGSNQPLYIRCSSVTEDEALGALIYLPKDFEHNIYAKLINYYGAAYLYNDISGSNMSKAARIFYGGTIKVVAINKAKTWVGVYYEGEDSEGRIYDGSRMYFCSLKEVELLYEYQVDSNGNSNLRLPENWP